MKRKGATAASLLLLTLGLGGHAALVSFIQAITTRPPAGIVGRPDLVRIRGFQLIEGGNEEPYPRPLAGSELDQYGRSGGGLQSVARWSSLPGTIRPSIGRPLVLVTIQYVDPSIFAVLGVRPDLGRLLTPMDTLPDAPRRVVISGELWRHHFDANPDIIGHEMDLDGVPTTIVGVAGASFLGAIGREGDAPPLWISPSASTTRRNVAFEAVALLASDDISVSAANATVAQRAETFFASQPLPPGVVRQGAEVIRLQGAMTLPVSASREWFYVTYGGVLSTALLLLVLLPVAALQVVAAQARTRDVAICLSLGASRGRIRQQCIVESLILAVLGVLLALIAYAFAIGRLADGSDLRLAPDLGTLGLTGLTACLVAVLLGMIPASYVSDTEPGEVLKRHGGGSPPVPPLARRCLLGLVALVTMILVGIGTVLKEGLTTTPGPTRWSAHDHEFMQVQLSLLSAPDREIAHRGIQDAVTRIAALPNVRGIAPSRNAGWPMEVHTISDTAILFTRRIGPEYLGLFDEALLEGRDLMSEDAEGAEESIIISKTAARRLFGTATPVGRHLVLGRGRTLARASAVVVGVFADGVLDLEDQSVEMAYVGRQSANATAYTIRFTGAAATLAAQTGQLLFAAAPDVAATMETWSSMRSRAETRSYRLRTFVRTMGGMALLLTTVGLWGMAALSVRQRRREAAIRQAVGATSFRAVHPILVDAFSLSFQGMAIGLIVSMLVSLVILGPRTAFGRLLVTEGVTACVLTAVTILAVAWPLIAMMRAPLAMRLRDE